MGIKRFYAIADNTITNAYDISLRTRATGSNMGASDILEVYSVYGQESSGSVELSRVLIKFPVTGSSDSIESARTNGDIPVSGNVNFYLKMFNARHSEQLPSDYTLNVLAVSQSWQEGYGLDMVEYADKTKDTIKGSNWMNRTSVPLNTWKKVGGDYHTASSNSEVMYTVDFEKGDEDLELDVTQLVEEWILGNAGGATEIKDNYGFGVFLTSSFEGYYANLTPAADDGVIIHNEDGQQKSFYTKRFFSRTSEFFFKRPVIEARWDSRKIDNRGNFYYSSSLATGEDNLNTLYLYNYVRGQLRNIPSVGTGQLHVSLYSGSAANNGPSGSALDLSVGGNVAAAEDTNATGGYVSTGIYSASFAFTGSTTLKTVYDVWHTGGEGTYIQFATGTITPKTFDSPGWNQYQQYTTKITNLKSSYTKDETARFRVFTRARDLTPTMYTVATSEIENTVVPSASFEIKRVVDDNTVINNSTGSSDYHTYLSYDISGSYFDLDMSLLEPGYMYGIRLYYHISDAWREQKELFKFRVEDN